jgi:hypothetical protein
MNQQAYKIEPPSPNLMRKVKVKMIKLIIPLIVITAMLWAIWGSGHIWGFDRQATAARTVWVEGKSLRECMGKEKVANNNTLQCQNGYFKEIKPDLLDYIMGK